MEVNIRLNAAAAVELVARLFEVVVDHSSASQLQGWEYDEFVFDNEPKWAAFKE